MKESAHVWVFSYSDIGHEVEVYGQPMPICSMCNPHCIILSFIMRKVILTRLIMYHDINRKKND